MKQSYYKCRNEHFPDETMVLAEHFSVTEYYLLEIKAFEIKSTWFRKQSTLIPIVYLECMN